MSIYLIKNMGVRKKQNKKENYPHWLIVNPAGVHSRAEMVVVAVKEVVVEVLVMVAQ